VREEHILREARFPRLKAHAESHEASLVLCRQISSACGEVCRCARSSDCIPMLAAMLLGHLVGEDMDYKSFLQAVGLADADAY
jgi:hemerythrin